MKRTILILMAALMLVSSGFAQKKVAKRLTAWDYENGVSWRTTADGDTVTGVAAAAASLDTVYVGILSQDGQYPESVFLMISTTNVNNQDSVVVSTRPVINGKVGSTAVQSDTIVTAGSKYQIELNCQPDKDGSVGYAFIFDGTKGADTDSTAYGIVAYGIYQE